MRPKKCRTIELNPDVTLFKPRGVPAVELTIVELQLDEWEALRLADHDGLHHASAGERMGVSRATFGRILERARHKVADALVNGKGIAIHRGDASR